MAYITLNKNSFFNNLNIIANKTNGVDKIALVLKDNAYGHGMTEMSSMASEFGIKKAVVRTHSEAMAVEKYFEYVLVLSDIPKIKSTKIRYTINELSTIKKYPSGTLVELKVDTGMHRNGINASELREAFSMIKDSGLVLEAVFTHHRSADELSSEWFWQNDQFNQVKQESISLANEFGFEKPRFHSANSASILRTESFSEDMARVGIAAYGNIQLPNALKVEGLKPVLSLYASRVSSRELKKGECVGYGATYRSEFNSIVSNYDFGYADGFLRACSNNYKTPKSIELVGRVSMDNSSFLSSDDEILVFDDATDIANAAGTISYEVLTSLKPHIQRKIV